MTGRVPAGLLLGLLAAGPLLADEPKLPDTKVFDKVVVDTLRDVHNKGADLYNTSKDFAGTYRMYQGALLTVRPLLAHRPAAQKLIDDGLDVAEKEPAVAHKAFKLHETIETVRSHLKGEPVKKPEDPKKPEDKTKKPEDKTKSVAPKTTVATAAGLSGKVMLKSVPLTGAEVTLVTLDQPRPRVFTAAIRADGSYEFPPPLPAGRYVAIVTAKAVPEKYQLTTTSGLVIEVKPGATTHDIELK